MVEIQATFEHRLKRAGQLREAVVKFVPAFKPQREQVEMDAFGRFLESIERLNERVAAVEDKYRQKAKERMDVVVTIRDRITRVLNVLRSNPAWKGAYMQAKSAADRFRGVRSVRPASSGTAPGDSAVKQVRPRAEQSYPDLASHFARFVQAASKAEKYTPPAEELGIEKLQALQAALEATNQAIDKLGDDLMDSKIKRGEAYTGEDGLRACFRDIKAAVKGQYGIKSLQWTQIASVKF